MLSTVQHNYLLNNNASYLIMQALTKLDQAEVQVAGLAGEGTQRLSLVVGVVEEAVQPALTEGYAILEVTGGRHQPQNMVSNVYRQFLVFIIFFS